MDFSRNFESLQWCDLAGFQDDRFKQSGISIQFVRPMCKEEAALNALLPAVLLRGCEGARDMREITLRLDDLYGASVGSLVRRIGDCQTTGFACNFIEDAFALEGDSVLALMAAFLGELLLQPVLCDGVFLQEYVENFGGPRNAMFRMKEQWHMLLCKFENSEKLEKIFFKK